MKTFLFLAVSTLASLSFAGAFNPPDCGAPQRLEEIKVTAVSSLGMASVKAYKTAKSCHNFPAKVPGVQIEIAGKFELIQSTVALATLDEGKIVQSLLTTKNAKGEKTMLLNFDEGSLIADIVLSGGSTSLAVQASDGFVNDAYEIGN